MKNRIRSHEYICWMQMRSRCNNPNHSKYKYYGAKGITVCDRWASFKLFIVDMGKAPTPKHTIDRVKTKGNYEPTNCRWATIREQQRNKSNNNIIEYNGVSLPLIEWAEIYGLSKSTLRSRIVKSRWTIEKSLTTPIR